MKCIVINEAREIVNRIEANADYISAHPEVYEITREEERIYDVGRIYLGQVFDEARRERAKKLEAFDIYKTNVLYGIETETAEEKEDIQNWYQAWLDFPETITAETYPHMVYPNTPEKIKKYVK